MCLIESYPWPGNVRELRNIVERLAILCDQERIEPHHLPAEIRQATCAPHAACAAPHVGGVQAAQAAGPRRGGPADWNAAFSSKRLERCQGNVSRAAEEIGIQRTNLHALMRKYGLDVRRLNTVYGRLVHAGTRFSR